MDIYSLQTELNLYYVFMEVIPSCLLLNKSHFFGLTQHKFILIHFGYPYICGTYFGLYVGHP